VFFQEHPLSAIRDLDQFRAQKIGFVFQSFFLLPTLTAVENVQIPMFEGSLSLREREKNAQELLAWVGMSHRADHRPMQLSVGERQRVAIARALANDPVLLLADEPTGNLDTRTAAEVLNLFDHLHHVRGMTIIMVTHGQEVADRAERIIRMRDGHVVPAVAGRADRVSDS
jgi:ABC-type lipoprotein export system ATPase subunit